MLDKNFADEFAADWIDAWNQHDLERILAHYADDFEMSSPMIIKMAGEPTGTLKGKQLVGQYWAKALQLFPDLHFQLHSSLVGVNSIVINYQGVSSPAAEVFYFNADGKVVKAFAHYG